MDMGAARPDSLRGGRLTRARVQEPSKAAFTNPLMEPLIVFLLAGSHASL